MNSMKKNALKLLSLCWGAFLNLSFFMSFPILQLVDEFSKLPLKKDLIDAKTNCKKISARDHCIWNPVRQLVHVNEKEAKMSHGRHRIWNLARQP